jgi:hypothetical protein
MTDTPDFISGRDEALGALLRAHLSAPDDAAFATRMRIAAVTAAEEGAWRAVARWTLPGLAAAALLLAAIGAALGGGTTSAQVGTASNTAAGSLVEMASGSTPDGGGALLAVMTY